MNKEEIAAANSNYFTKSEQGSTSSIILIAIGFICCLLGFIGFFYYISIGNKFNNELKTFYYVIAVVNLLSGIFILALINVVNAIYDKLYKAN